VGRSPASDPQETYFGIPADRRRAFSLAEMKGVLDVEHKLADRVQCSTEEFNAALGLREKAYGKVTTSMGSY
jgi:hypothetical protein